MSGCARGAPLIRGRQRLARSTQVGLARLARSIKCRSRVNPRSVSAAHRGPGLCPMLEASAALRRARDTGLILAPKRPSRDERDSPRERDTRYRTEAFTDAAVCPNRTARSSAVRMPPRFGLISLALA